MAMELVNTVTVSGEAGRFFDPGYLFQSRVPQNVLNDLKDNLGTTYFRSESENAASFFFNNIVNPIAEMKEKLQFTIGNISLVDDFVWFKEIEDMKYIPECMRVPLLYHPYVRKLASEGRIEDFGIDVDTFDKENPYQRLIDNGVIKNVADCPIEDGHHVLEFKWEWHSTDPILELKQLECIRRMYELIDKDRESGSEISPTDRQCHIA